MWKKRQIKKSDRKHWFFFLFTRVFSTSRRLFSKRSNLRGHLRRPGSFCLLFLFLCFPSLSRLLIRVFFCLPGNLWSFLSHYPLFFPQKMLQCIAPSPSSSLKLCSFLLFSFSSLTWMTVNTVALIKRLSVKTTNNPLSSWSSWPELSITLQIHPSQCNEISYHKCGRWSEILP